MANDTGLIYCGSAFRLFHESQTSTVIVCCGVRTKSNSHGRDINNTNSRILYIRVSPSGGQHLRVLNISELEALKSIVSGIPRASGWFE